MQPIFTTKAAGTGRIFWLFLAASLCQVGWLSAEDVAVPAPPAPPVRRLIIEPSSSRLSLATANLTVSPLALGEQKYRGDYQIKVVPFSFKNDHGKLLLNFNSESSRKMANGKAVEFTGKAVSDRDQKIKLIRGKTAPESLERGAVSFIVTTEDGDLLFNSKYHFSEK